MHSPPNYATCKHTGTTNYKSMNMLAEGPKDKAGSNIQPILAQCCLTMRDTLVDTTN